MNLSRKKYVLPADSLEDPLLWSYPLPHVPDWHLDVPGIFGAGVTQRLKTFGRDAVDPDGPHWIAVRSGTPLHHDPGYLRYTVQAVVVNDGYLLGGWDETVAHPIPAGSVFCLDAQSPHQLLGPRQGEMYVACSTDSPHPILGAEIEPTIARLLTYLENS